jgi:predicted RNA-binding Zn-ribbon protein involved in translation (DUF1610 family)
MTTPVKSVHDLTRCTACRAHIRAAERPSATECPFCGANLRSGQPRIALPSGRGSMLAASLLALSACGGGQTAPEPITDDTASEPAETSAIESEPAPEPVEPAGENEVQNDVAEPDEYAEEPADEMAPAPRYGLAPMRPSRPERLR